ncbi:MAG TPA: outer membrane beta-barrel protein [Gemmatimonadales bacterium]|nr:outer membrane beta-barrel protein [Gemmatimonadales bacterium]
MRRLALLVAAAVALLALPGELAAQATHYPAWANGRVSVDGFYGRYWLDGRGDDWTNADGVGGRILYHLTPMADTTRNDLASRTALGVFAVYAPEEHRGFTGWHFGAQADLHLLSHPWLRRFDPFVSLGVGAFRTELDRAGPVGVEFADETNTSFALSPAMGARVNLYRGLGLRAEATDVMVFRDGVHHNLGVNGGLTLAF